MTGHKTKIDFLSFTFSPEPLKRVAELAKEGAILKSIPRFGASAHALLRTLRPMPTAKGLLYVRTAPGFNDPRALRQVPVPYPVVEQARGLLTSSMYAAMESNLRSHYKQDANTHINREMKAILGQLLDASSLELNPEANYWDAYNDLIHNYGVQFLDSLCCSELEVFFRELNFEIGVPIPGPRFTFRHRKGGVHGYASSADLLVDGIAAGLVAWGAANHGCFVSFTGTACDTLDFGALHRVLVGVPGLRITRVDLALDDYQGKSISYLKAVEAAECGGFHPPRGTSPKWMAIQGGHFVPEMLSTLRKRFGLIASAGCSFYVGSRANGKCARIYEKGKQMESAEHPNWVRAEGELHSKDRIIPLDVLINPDVYFAGMYPQFSVWLNQVSLAEVEPLRITTFKNKFKVGRDNAVTNMSRMAGRLINWLKGVEGRTDAAIVAMLTAHLDPDDVPSRLLLPLPFDVLDGTYQLAQ